jgi:winged helix-turn-helix protein
MGRLHAELDKGPAGMGGRGPEVDPGPGRGADRALFHLRYTLRGVSYLLHRVGYPQVPVHRAAERNEAAIAAWRAETWAKVRG